MEIKIYLKGVSEPLIFLRCSIIQKTTITIVSFSSLIPSPTVCWIKTDLIDKIVED